MPSAELRRRLKQRDTMREMIQRAHELGDIELRDRRVRSLDELEQLVTQLQAEPDPEQDDGPRRRRR